MIPYKTLAGQSFPLGSIGNDDLRLREQNTTEDECREYAETLEESGYKKRTEKVISAGSKYSYNVNLFYAYQNETENVFIFWDAHVHTVFITVEPLGLMPENKPVKRQELIQPKATLFRLRSGLCCLVQLENGEFIIIDGGVKDEDAVMRLYEFLKENSLNGQPTIALWIFTHPHKDHIGLVPDFLREYKDVVKVKAFAYQFPNCDKIKVAMESEADIKVRIELLEDAIKNFYPNSNVYTLHTGQSYFFPGAEIEILYSLDDTYPYPYVSFNDTSAVCRVKFANGKTAMYLGDSMNENCKKIAGRYGDYLKSDIMQLSHHGLIGGDRGLYELIDPEICLWASAEQRFLGLKEKQRYQYCLGEGGCDYNAYLRDDSIRKRTHYHHSVTTTIEL